MTEAEKVSFNHLRVRRACFNIAGIAMFTLLLIFTFNVIQNTSTRKQQRQSSQRILNELTSTIAQNKTDAMELRKIFHNSNRQMLADLMQMFSGDLIEQYAASSSEDRAAWFSEILNRTGAEYLYMIDVSGRIIASPESLDIGKKIEDLGLLNSQDVQALERLDVVTVPNKKSGLYFYSLPIESTQGRRYILLAERSSILDVQYNSLTDMRELLKSVRINQQGFVFAVDLNTNEFLYFPDGKKDLKGHNFAEVGLGAEVLKDGYYGIQKINGKAYYCVSSYTSGSVLLTAAVPINSIFLNNISIVFWISTLFIMVMIVSLAYAVFVHNDLLRQQVESDLKPLFKLKDGTTVVINGSVQRKYLSLVAIGIVLIFCGCLYVQTLHSISVADTASSDAMVDIEQNIDNANVLSQQIRSYYEDRYLDKTKILSYMLEIDPQALNQGGQKMTYSQYDDRGNRQTVPDDEGNPLQSIAYSKILRIFAQAMIWNESIL